MKKIILFLCAVIVVSCKAHKIAVKNESETDFVIVFGSCNKISLPNLLWDDVLHTKPDVWIWGGDNIYADTSDMNELRIMYEEQNSVAGYNTLKSNVEIIGTWDDHDYGSNDGGTEFKAKKESQQEFLDFMAVPPDSPRRTQEGVYTTHNYSLEKGLIKVLVLDTRYFRTPLTPDTETNKRVKPNSYGEGTILGATQWDWLEKELKGSKADFNIILSSIQVLSNKHGFECWGNFPHEVDRLENLISDSKANGVIVLSGDRHISEFSSKTVKGMDYPLVDFTSSGLTHAYRDFKGEENPFRIGKVVNTESFGILKFNFDTKKVNMYMLGDGGEVLGALQQSY